MQICPSVRPLDHGDAIAAATAALSFVMPFANAATRLPLALSSQASSSVVALRLIMSWNARTASRASAMSATPLSIAATIMVSAFVRWSRPFVSKRAIVRAAGA